MIIGTGCDIVKISRIITNINPKFINRVLTRNEQIIAESRIFNPSYIAKRWAAKEAVSKSFGCGIGMNLSFLDLEILNHKNGQPYINFLIRNIISPNYSGELSLINSHISISDCTDYAMCTVTLEKR